MKAIKISSIRMDGGTQPGAELDQSVIESYAEAMGESANFPPVTIFHDGKDYWLADGFHRVNAAKKIGYLEIEADIKQGTRRDAILFSVGANATHGHRRSNPDKRRAVETLLNDDEWAKWSDSEIARRCFVDHKTVASLRKKVSWEFPKIDRKVERNGTIYTQNTANIGKGRKEEFVEDETPADLQKEINEEIIEKVESRPSLKPMIPIRGINQQPLKTSVELPHDPVAAANTIKSSFDKVFISGLIIELQNYLSEED